MAVQLNPPMGNLSQILKAILWVNSHISQDQKTNIVQALQYANGQQAQIETEANN